MAQEILLRQFSKIMKQVQEMARIIENQVILLKNDTSSRISALELAGLLYERMGSGGSIFILIFRKQKRLSVRIAFL